MVPLSIRAPIHQFTLGSNRQAQKFHDQALRPSLCHLLLVATDVLRLSPETIYTACVLLHRYVLANGEDDSLAEPHWIIAACLLLACKSEEEPRRLRDFINCASIFSISKEKNGGDNNITQIEWNPVPLPLDEGYWEKKSKIVDTEQLVLRWIEFDVSVSHPHRAVVLFLNDLGQTNNVVSVAWKRLNDGVWRVAALQHPAWLLAIAAIRFVVVQEAVALPVGIQDKVLDLEYWRRAYGLMVNESVIQSVDDSLS